DYYCAIGHTGGNYIF
nr:immunoglobulin light chain junction region [Macaca mulatta]